MKVLDNKIDKFGNDLKNEIKNGDRCYIASAVFSMYGFEELKKKLKKKKEKNYKNNVLKKKKS